MRNIVLIVLDLCSALVITIRARSVTPGRRMKLSGSNGLRLSYSNAAPERIREGIRRLQRAIAGVAS